MPYMIHQEPADSGQWWVYKQGADGKPTGAPKNKKPYPSKVKAEPLLRALYAAMKKKDEAVSELDLTVLSPSGVGFDPLLTQEETQYTEQSPSPTERCSTCVFYAAPGFCYLVRSAPLTILPEGVCNQWTELEVLADPAGTHEMATGTSEAIHEMSTNLPIASGDPKWDAGAARERIWKWATNDKGEFDEAKAAQAFLIHDGEGKGGLKDPIADVIDGHLEVIPAALRAAASRLPQTDASGKSGAARVLEHYKKKAGIGEMETFTVERFPNIPSLICEIREARLRGSYPDIAFAPGVNIDALKAIDPDPFFMTLPIAEVNLVSGNKLRYTEELCRSLAEQINTDTPTGIRGHIKEEERNTAYPNPEVYWVGAEFIANKPGVNPDWAGKTWGKVYIPPGETREEYRIKKAMNGVAATSIYGKPISIQEYKDGTYTPVMTLEHVDLAPPKRAATGKAYQFAVTTEMADSMTPPTPANPDPDHDGDNDLQDPNEENEMGDVIDPMVGLTANWKTMQPGDVCEQIATMLGEETSGKVAELLLAKQNKKAVAMEMAVVAPGVISEFEQQKTTVDQLKVTVAELNAANVNFQRREFEGVLAQQIAVATPYAGSDAKLLKATQETRQILELKARMALKDSLNVAQIAETVQTVVTNSPAIMEMWRDTLMGPSARIGGLDNHKPVNGLYKPDEMFDEQRMKDARAATGIN